MSVDTWRGWWRRVSGSLLCSCRHRERAHVYDDSEGCDICRVCGCERFRPYDPEWGWDDDDDAEAAEAHDYVGTYGDDCEICGHGEATHERLHGSR